MAHESECLQICLVTSAYPPTADGFATYTYDLAVSLVELGHAVTVLCCDHRDQGLDEPLEFCDSGARIVRLPPGRTLAGRVLSAASGLAQVGESYDIFKALRRYHRRLPFDVIEFSNWHAPALFHALWKLAPQVIRASTTVKQASRNTLRRKGAPGDRKERAGVRKLAWLEAFAVQRSDLIMVSNESHWRAVGDDYKIDATSCRPVAVVPLGVHVASETIKELPPARAAATPCRLLYVGRLSLRKGFDLLMRALPVIRAGATCAIELTVIGEDVRTDQGRSTWEQFSRELEESTCRCITYLGLVTDKERDYYYKKAHVFIGPSRYESFGLMYVEAMAYGVPVVGSRVGGIPEVVEDGVTGLLVDPDDARALAAAVLRLVNDEELRIAMGSAAKASVSRRFTRERMARATVEAYRLLRLKQVTRVGMESCAPRT